MISRSEQEWPLEYTRTITYNIGPRQRNRQARAVTLSAYLLFHASNPCWLHARPVDILDIESSLRGGDALEYDHDSEEELYGE